MGCEKENQDGPADGELHSIEAKRQGQGPPKAPSQVFPHQVGSIAVEGWWQKCSEGGCSMANGGSPLTSGLLVTKRKPLWAEMGASGSKHHLRARGGGDGWSGWA